MIIDAIKLAHTEHVVYFLLAAYVETLGYADNYGIPEKVKRLPIGGHIDVHERLGVMRDILHTTPVHGKAHVRPVVEEAVDVFDAASEQLRKL